MSSMGNLQDYLDSFSDLAPITGQPGLFRHGSELANRNERDESGFEIAESRGSRRDAKRTFMSGLEGCGCDTTRSPGLGSVASTTQVAQAAWVRYGSMKSGVQALLDRFPRIDAARYREVAQRLVQLPGDTLVRLSAEELAMFLQAGMTTVAKLLGLANAMITGPSAAHYEAKSRTLVNDANAILNAIQRILDAVNTADGLADRARRAVGLAEPIAVSTGALVAGIIAGTIVVVVGAVLLYALLSSISTGLQTLAAAELACDRAATEGRPCTGEDWMRFYEAANAEARRNGAVPNIADLLQQAMNSVVVGGFVVLGALLAYGLWVSAPAASEAREGLRRRASAYR
jgi:hypothetical protein